MNPGSFGYGVPYPGIYVVDANGKVVSNYFEDDYKERVSTADILAGRLGVYPDRSPKSAETKHLAITAAASNDLIRPGLRIRLNLDLALKPGMHVYAPGVEGYIRLTASSNPRDSLEAPQFRLSPSEMLHLPAIGETVPVYRNHTRIECEITFGQDGELKPLLIPSGELIVKGTLRYQSCDDRTCYIPQTFPLEWQFKYQGVDRTPVPPELQRKPN